MLSEVIESIDFASIDETSIETFLSGSLKCAEQVWRARGGETRYFTFGPVCLEVRFVNGLMQDIVCPILQHCEISEEKCASDRAVVYVVVSDQLDVAAPPDHWKFPEETKEDYQRVCWKPEAGLAMSSDDSNGLWHIFDLVKQSGLYWVRSVDGLPGWEYGSPLRHFIHWASLSHNCCMLHGAGIGRDGRGVLLAGPGGSGKSTMTAAAISSGWQVTGDDFVLTAEQEKFGTVSHPIFDIMKLTGMAEEKFAHHVSKAINPNRNTDEKALIPVSLCAGDNFVRQLPVQAILSMRLSHADKSEIVPLSKIATVGALAPSTMNILRTGMKETFRDCGALARRLPCFEFRVGKDPLEGLEVLHQFLEQDDKWSLQ